MKKLVKFTENLKYSEPKNFKNTKHKRFSSLLTMRHLAVWAGICGLGQVAWAADSGDKSGVIAGGSIGLAFDSMDSKGSHSISNNLVGPELSVRAGYQHYFMGNLGVRGYIEYGFRKTYDTKVINDDGNGAVTMKPIGTNNRYDINADVLFDFLTLGGFDIGIIAGLFVGYNHISNAISFIHADGTNATRLGFSGVQYGLNLGGEITLFSHHIISVLGKIPFSTSTTISPRGNHVTLHYYSVSVGYGYRFAL